MLFGIVKVKTETCLSVKQKQKLTVVNADIQAKN